MLPPNTIPPFWHALFIIVVNGSIFLCSIQGSVSKGGLVWILCYNRGGSCSWRSLCNMSRKNARSYIAPPFGRERTCPLCRALVKPADLRSFADGSTSLFFQLC